MISQAPLGSRQRRKVNAKRWKCTEHRWRAHRLLVMLIVDCISRAPLMLLPNNAFKANLLWQLFYDIHRHCLIGKLRYSEKKTNHWPWIDVNFASLNVQKDNDQSQLRAHEIERWSLFNFENANCLYKAMIECTRLYACPVNWMFKV